MAGEDGQEGRGGGKGGDEEQEERTDGWMTTYSDMVTLLMTFFVLMFALSNVDNQRVMLFFAGMSRDGLSAQEFDRIVDMFNPGDDPDIFIPEPGEWDDDEPEDLPEFGDFDNPELRSLYSAMVTYIGLAGIGDHIHLVFNGDFLLMTLRNDILFNSGQAIVLPEMRYIATVIAELLSGTHNPDNPFEIVVTGHTDNVPINTFEFPSNWHLSVRRAVSFINILIDESGIDPFFFQARGASEYRPIATNETSEGRALNRRVEVMVTIPRDYERERLHPDTEVTYPY
ncbi:MAG: OmpA family protein [Oscillospiraceae bacterium]|nr:OmpA family protein [Oscillospiraceae bacterium]